MKKLFLIILFLFSSTLRAQTPQALTNARWQWSDSNGVLAGGFLYTCVAGSTCPGTPQATFTDYTGGVQNQNPVVLDSLGSASVWLTSGLGYKLVLQNASHTLVWSADGIVAGSVGPPGTVTSIATGTGLTGGPITSTGTISLANTAVTPGSYVAASITVDQQGRITAASNSGAAPGASTVSSMSNDVTNPTILNKLAKSQPFGGLRALVKTDTVFNSAIVGVCQSGCGNSGFPTIVVKGPASCIFDGSTTAGDMVVPSPTVDGDCHDAGAGGPQPVGSFSPSIGTIGASHGGVGTYTFDYANIEADGGTNLNAPFFAQGGTIPIFGNLRMENTTSAAGIQATGTHGFQLPDAGGTNGIRNSTSGSSGADTILDISGAYATAYGKLEISNGVPGGAFFTPIDDEGTQNGTLTLRLSAGNIIKITLDGGLTIANPNVNDAGQIVSLILCQNGAGAHSLSWGAAWISPPAMPQTASACMVARFLDLLGGANGSATPHLQYIGGSSSPGAQPVYTINGTLLPGAHSVIGTGTLNETKTFTGAAVFTSNATYVCNAQNTTNAANAPLVAYISGTQVSFTGSGGGGDSYSFACIGN